MLFFHVKLLNILGFVHLSEKVLDKYIIMHFEIKGVLSLIICSMVFGGVELLPDFLTSQFNNKRIETIA